ncbi:hypothetical protein SAMN04488011_10886 [Palleronia pelagia]|uniref:Uncharacterized protein n=2 Tax=Palleronia pelagia TaxID=387096 RepID=A0A1H8KQD9_9RHOB|nr:hypothetical protein SAMN04488011_10886 [Palleronia pelagia]
MFHRRHVLERCAAALSIALVVTPAMAQEDRPMLSGNLEAILPQADDLPGPMTSLIGNWALSVEDDRPVIELTLEWSGDVDENTLATLGMVAVVQTPSIYVAFLDIPMIEGLAANTHGTVSATYEWGELLSTDLSTGPATYLSADDAREALNGGARVSQMIITSADFAER